MEELARRCGFDDNLCFEEFLVGGGDLNHFGGEDACEVLAVYAAAFDRYGFVSADFVLDEAEGVYDLRGGFDGADLRDLGERFFGLDASLEDMVRSFFRWNSGGFSREDVFEWFCVGEYGFRSFLEGFVEGETGVDVSGRRLRSVGVLTAKSFGCLGEGGSVEDFALHLCDGFEGVETRFAAAVFVYLGKVFKSC